MTNKIIELYVTEDQQRLCVLHHPNGEGRTLFSEEDLAAMLKLIGGKGGADIIRAVASAEEGA